LAKLYLLLFVLFFNIPSNAGGLEDYINAVKTQCLNINPLIIKKSLIELTHDQNCGNSFTSLLLRECPNVSCSLLLNNWVTFNNAKAGAVIGK
jgi:hypothetical protein